MGDCNQPCQSLLQALSEHHAWQLMFVESNARLDARLDRIEQLVQSLPEERQKQQELYDILLKAKGARVVLIGILVAIAGIVHFTTDIVDWWVKFRN